jgi:hypothetical protein
VELTAQEVSVLEKDNLAFADIKLVDSMRRKGLLMGSTASWQAHYQALIKTVTLPEMAGTILPLILFPVLSNAVVLIALSLPRI